tara:strand:+ start:77912 stop:78163 length:252 start_codon:yes stop_codon:yes gene_type:complete
MSRQVHQSVMSKGSGDPAVNRLIIENDLIEAFNWLPQDIEKIPYKKLQELFIVKEAKEDARNAKKEIEANRKKPESTTSRRRM